MADEKQKTKLGFGQYQVSGDYVIGPSSRDTKEVFARKHGFLTWSEMSTVYPETDGSISLDFIPPSMNYDPHGKAAIDARDQALASSPKKDLQVPGNMEQMPLILPDNLESMPRILPGRKDGPVYQIQPIDAPYQFSATDSSTNVIRTIQSQIQRDSLSGGNITDIYKSYLGDNTNG